MSGSKSRRFDEIVIFVAVGNFVMSTTNKNKFVLPNFPYSSGETFQISNT